MPNERRRIHYSGQVQGVGFRMTARRLARGYAVSGYVKNLADGRVELVVEGDSEGLGPFLRALASEFRSEIADVESETGPATGEFGSEVSIRH